MRWACGTGYDAAMNPSDDGYSIQAVSRRTGVHPVTLRAWERRYGLIRPARTERGHRRYSDGDLAVIERILSWLDRGLPISQVRPLLEQDGTSVTAVEGPWRAAMDEALQALDRLNVRRLEQLFQRLTADYPLARVVTGFCDPLRDHLRALPGQGASQALLDTFLRQKLAGRLLARAPGRRERAWLVMAVGDPLPALIQSAVADRPVWCLETPVAWPALPPWLADSRLAGVVWMLGERPSRRQIAQLWPRQEPEGTFLCAGPALAGEPPLPAWLRCRPGGYQAVVKEMDDADSTAQQQGEQGATGLVS